MAGWKKEQVHAHAPSRRELAAQGLEIISEVGFPAFDLKMLSERCGVTEAYVRSLFASPYDVVFGESKGRLEWFGSRLVERRDGLDVVETMSSMADELIDAMEADADYERRRQQLIDTQPQLVAWQQQLDSLVIRRCMEAMSSRIGSHPVTRVRARTTIASGLFKLRATLAEWAWSDGEISLRDLYSAVSQGTGLLSAVDGAGDDSLADAHENADGVDLRETSVTATAG